jgi:hypothetical protein
MRKQKPTTRVIGVYPHKSGSTRVVWLDHGTQRTEYFKTELGAQARAAEIRGGTVGGPSPPPVQIGDGATRVEWLCEIWAQIKSCRDITDPPMRIQALDAIARAYKAVRDDLAAIEAGVKKNNEPSSLSDVELDAKIIELRTASHGRSTE